MKHNSIRSRLSWRLTYALILVFAVENLMFVVYHLIEYRHQFDEFIADLGEFGILILFNLLSLPVMLFLAQYLIKKELKPLDAAARAAESIQGGELSSRINVENPPEEIDKVATVFNAAFDRYHDLLEKAQQFNMDASHQLRTPLAIMRTTGEVALSQSRDSAEYRDVIGSMLEETDHLHKIVTQLLDLAKISNQSVELSAVNVRELFERVVDRFGAVIEDYPGRVAIECGADICVNGSETLLVEALSNLLDNALTHTPEDKKITLAAALRDDDVLLEVKDQGPGIPPEDAARLTDRFYQRNEGEGKGSGLGLAIVKAIAELHGGALSIASEKSSGTTVAIRLPLHT